MSIKPLFTVTATTTGGRNGHTEASDHSIAADLSVPKQMGGPGKPNTTTPEHLFAAGYAACFGGALDYVAKQQKKNAQGAVVTCAVSIGPRDAGGFELAVKLHIQDKSLPKSVFPRDARQRAGRFGGGRSLGPAVVSPFRLRRFAQKSIQCGTNQVPRQIESLAALCRSRHGTWAGGIYAIHSVGLSGGSHAAAVQDLLPLTKPANVA
jgi:lipoyl-dependent peroxiredoxin